MSPTPGGTSGPTPRGFREPIVSPEIPTTPASWASFADLVRMLAESIAAAQFNLDRGSAELVRELAESKVEVVPEVTEVVDSEGNVSYEQAEAREVSLLDLGVTPTFYQFAKSTVEVVMDLKVVEHRTEPGGQPRYGLSASTAGLQAERRLNRELTAHSKLTATLVPVPAPANLEPSRTTVAEGG